MVKLLLITYLLEIGNGHLPKENDHLNFIMITYLMKACNDYYLCHSSKIWQILY